MKQNAIRTAVQALGLTNSALLSLLDEGRTDGRSTSRATVSRWINGHREPPPAVRVWLKDRLINLLKERPPSVGGPRIVVVGGGKGGSGTTPICAFLCAAARQRGYRALLGATECTVDALSYWARDLVSPRKGPARIDLSRLDRVKADLKGSADLLLVDVGNKSMLSEADLAQIDLQSIDLAVVPFSPSKWLDFDPAAMVADALLTQGFERFMLLPMMDRMSLASLIQRASFPPGLQRLGKHVCDTVIFKRSTLSLPRSWLSGASSDFEDEDLMLEYWSVLDQVLLRLGVPGESIELPSSDLSHLSVEELVDLLSGPAHREDARRSGPVLFPT